MVMAALVVVGVVCDPRAVRSLRTEMLRVCMLQSLNALTLTMQGTQDPSGWREGKLQSGQWPQVESQGGGREWEVGVNWLAGRRISLLGRAQLLYCSRTHKPCQHPDLHLGSGPTCSRFVGALCRVLKYTTMGARDPGLLNQGSQYWFQQPTWV